ncbi:MAG: sulfotransferase [Defluviimonas sp.]|uniref:sulfotransferase n=1 Tax=Albidovulum sp. TaxID=1872424 RepID=UPI002A292D8D|nr:sulfotransferase [Defluviimonas sp.]
MSLTTRIQKILSGRDPAPAGAPAPDRMRPAHAGERSFAFVTGCSRSGTTALTDLLNRHPDVAIGFERFAWLARDGRLTPDLFTPERFRDFREGDTHHPDYSGSPMRSAVLDKVHAARVIGDKIPRLIEHLDMLDGFAGARVIFIVREPYAVAQSFVGRSTEAGGKWPAGRDHVAAVAEFNRAMASVLTYARTGRPYLVLDYDRLFGSREGLDDIWTFLDVDPDRLGRTDDIFDKSAALAGAGKLPEIAREVALKADFDAFRQVLGLDRMRLARHL